MPWIDEELCTGCGTCVEECPVGAITLQTNDLAVIDDQTCIRCGTCHDDCAEGAVRHDGERSQQKVAANLEWTERLLRHYDTPAEQSAFIDRITKYFALQGNVAEQTIQVLAAVKADPVQGIRSAIQRLDADDARASAQE
jgi:ferredoxin